MQGLNTIFKSSPISEKACICSVLHCERMYICIIYALHSIALYHLYVCMYVLQVYCKLHCESVCIVWYAMLWYVDARP